MGVPFEGKYKEIFNSDAVKFGGSGKGNPRMKTSREEDSDGRKHAITVQVPPMSICIFSCTPEKAVKPVQKKAAARNTGKRSAKNTDKSHNKKPSRNAGVAPAGKPGKQDETGQAAQSRAEGKTAEPERKPADVIPLKKRTKK